MSGGLPAPAADQADARRFLFRELPAFTELLCERMSSVDDLDSRFSALVTSNGHKLTPIACCCDRSDRHWTRAHVIACCCDQHWIQAHAHCSFGQASARGQCCCTWIIAQSGDSSEVFLAESSYSPSASSSRLLLDAKAAAAHEAHKRSRAVWSFRSNTIRAYHKI